MKAWLCDDLGGVDALQLCDLPTPEPAPGQVRVRIHAASLNFPDLLTVQGKYQIRPALPFVPGSEYSGTVEAVGAGVSEVRVGTPVVSLGVTGGFATHAIADARSLIPLATAMDLDDAAAFVFTYGTSWHALHDRAALRSGETVLVLGAAGGVGSAAVQIAVAAGARVIAAASSAEKCDFCRRLGAHATIELGREDLRTALKAHTDGRGADIVYDPVGSEWSEPAFRSIAWRGRYLVVGFAGGSIPALPFNLPLLKGASIVGVFWGDFVRREAAAFRCDLQRLFDGYATGALRPAIDQRFGLSELPQAYDRMASRRVRGKVLVCPQR